MDDLPKLRVVIPTRDRLDSLRMTLEALATGRAGSFDVHVMDNAPTPQVSAAVLPKTPYPVHISHVAEPGKGHAIRAALASVDPSRHVIVAILDDDMTPAPNWAATVIESCERRPQFAIFAGRSYVLWPEKVEVPIWARDPLVQGVGLSVIDLGADRDYVMGEGVVGYPSGNHYWFRASVLSNSPAFPTEGWTPDMEFVVASRRAGHSGVFVPEVRAAHRVQPHLLELETLFARAEGFGYALGRTEVHVERTSTPIRAVVCALRKRKWQRIAARLASQASWQSGHSISTTAVVNEVRRLLDLGKALARAGAPPTN